MKGTLHWVSVQNAIDAEVRIYDRLFIDEDPAGYKDKAYTEFLNPDSLNVNKVCKLEPSLKNAKAFDHFQFQRLGYFNLDPDSTSDRLIFNRTVPLRDSWSKEKK